MNPGESAQATGVRSHEATSAIARAATSGDVGRAAHDLDEAHHRRRIEEVETEDALRAGRRLGDRGDRERARVRREDRVGRGDGVEHPEDRPLEVQILERGLDDDVGLRPDGVERVAVPEASQPPVDPVVDRVGVELQSRRAAGEPVTDPLPPALDRGLVDVVEDDLVAGLERELGDPGAHRSGADDPDDVRWTSDRLERLERLAAVAAVEERAALGRAEGAVHHDLGRVAPGQRTSAGSAGGAMPTRGGCSRPAAVMRSEVQGTAPRELDLDREAEGCQPIRHRRLDQLERRAADERRQQVDGDAAAVDRDAIDDPEIDDRDRPGSPGPAPRRGPRGRSALRRPGGRLGYHAATGSSRRTAVNSFQSQRNGSP